MDMLNYLVRVAIDYGVDEYDVQVLSNGLLNVKRLFDMYHVPIPEIDFIRADIPIFKDVPNHYNEIPEEMALNHFGRELAKYVVDHPELVRKESISYQWINHGSDGVRYTLGIISNGINGGVNESKEA